MNNYRFSEKDHCHLLNGQPLFGTSTVVGVLGKPGLVWWSAGKSLEPIGFTPTKTNKAERLAKASEALAELHEIEEPSEYLKLLDKCYRNHKDSLDKSADKGIDLHYTLQRYIESIMKNELIDVPSNELDRILPFIEWSKTNVKKFLWSEAHCYDESPDMWVGGIFDFMAELNSGEIVLGDFKSSPKPYLSHWLQAGGYILQTEKNGIFDKDGNQLGKLDKPIDKIIVVPFGAKEVVPIFNEIPISDLKINFKNCVALHKLKTKWEE